MGNIRIQLSVVLIKVLLETQISPWALFWRDSFSTLYVGYSLFFFFGGPFPSSVVVFTVPFMRLESVLCGCVSFIDR